ncbi:hypothetical protein Neosp_002335 [[Neocosmospora] mangrovei]
MADKANNQDKGFGLPPAPTIAPGFAHEWPELEHPEMASDVETVLLAHQHYLAAQNNRIILQLENLLLTTSRTQRDRSNISSAEASTGGGGDTSIPSIPGDRKKKKRENPQGKGVKKSGSPISAATGDSDHQKATSRPSRVKKEPSQ